MAIIECEYSYPSCRYIKNDGCPGPTIGYTIYGPCSEEYECKRLCYYPSFITTNDLGRTVFHENCVNLMYLSRVFSKSVKNYEYDEGEGLKIGRQHIYIDDIINLSINGKTFVKDGNLVGGAVDD